ncbi:MAG: hypothetical protein HYU63_05220, partial [Armatimonadetes bacterium]|nr:hypothetical protein [Armatimonadota bacterium]
RKGWGADTLKNLSSKGATISIIYDELSKKDSLKDLTDLINAYHKEQNLPKNLAREKLEKQKK